MTAEQAFSQILDSDETIVEAFKPKKTRAITIAIIRDCLIALILAAVGAIFLWMSLSGAKSSDGQPLSPIFGIILLSIGGLIVLSAFVTNFVRWNKAWYCYTNKRVIIRSGFIGADYKTLDYNGIAAIDVRVDFLDKLVKPNTGKILFGSASAPIMTTNFDGRQRNDYGGYFFFAIENPYDVYKRIKEYVATAKGEKK